jgi:hypothetical protein
MTSAKKVALFVGTFASFAGCMHAGGAGRTRGSLGGAVTIDSLTAARTAILRVQNSSASDVRIYTVIDGQANYVTKATPGETRTSVLDPNLFPVQAISFETWPLDGTPRRIIGPYKVGRGETIDLVVGPSSETARAIVHRSTRRPAP